MPFASRISGKPDKLPFTLSPLFAVLVTVLGLMLTTFLADSVRRNELSKVRQETELQQTIIRLEIKRRMEERVRAIDRLVKRWELWGKPPRSNWEAEANLYIQGHEGYQSIGWVNPSYDLEWLVPLEGNEASLDMDMRFERARRIALETAKREHRTTITGPLFLVEGGLGFRIVIPIYRNGVFGGWVVSAFRSHRLFSQILHENISPGYGIRLDDSGTPLFFRDRAEANREWSLRSPLQMLHRDWTLTVWPKKAILAQANSFAAGILLAGLIISILCGWLVHFAQVAWFRRHAELESRFKSEFLANMSHEIRTPLSAVIGYAEALALPGPQLPQQAREDFIGRIRKNATYLGSLIDDILDITRVEAGKITTESELFSLEDLLVDIHEMYGVAMKGRRVHLEVIVCGEVPRTISSDPKRLRQILTNLISNAFKFTHEGLVQLKVEGTSRQTEGLELSFTVTDTGSGIRDEDQQRIFLPLERGTVGTQAKVGGAGIGLSLSRKLARYLGGDLVLVRSQIGKGSEFRFSLPILLYAEERIEVGSFETTGASERPVVEPLAGELMGVRVLSVEDDRDIQDLVRHYLSLAGAFCDCASNGIEGVEKALHGDYDLILMDMQMPLMGGQEASRKLREVGCHTPIISLTARLMREETQGAIAAGANGCLAKPFTFDQLVDCVAHYRRLRFPAVDPAALAANFQSSGSPDVLPSPSAGERTGAAT